MAPRIVFGVALLAGGVSCGQGFHVGAPETVLSRDRLEEAGVGGIDASLYALNDGGRWKWFCTSRWRHVYSLGPRDDPFAEVVCRTGQFENLPDRYTDTRVGFARDRRWGNITWIANVYRDPASGDILSFVHVEKAPKERGGVYFSLGLAISKDGGKSFRWCGHIIRPELSYETWSKHWHRDNLREGFIYPNTGLANYILKDGWFYLYYTDTRDKPDVLVNGAAVARARVDKVMASAQDFTTVAWRKYHEGRWNEPGLGGRFTPLDIEPLGFLHGDAAYNRHLDRYVLVTRQYFYAGDDRKVFGSDWQHAETGAVLISFSQDGLDWSGWRTVHRDARAHDYPSIISMGDDNEVTGKSFWVYYKYFHETMLPDIDWHRHRWDRVRVTLDDPAPADPRQPKRQPNKKDNH